MELHCAAMPKAWLSSVVLRGGGSAVVKLGISLGWKPPRPFALPNVVRENFSNWVGVSLTDPVARGIEQATDHLIEACCIEAGYTNERTGKVVPTDAEFAPTRRRLKKTLKVL